MGKLAITVLSVALAVGVFAGLWVGLNLVFDQATKRWERFAALTGALVGFVFFAIVDGNRALQTIGPRDDVRESLYLGSDDGFTIIGDLVGVLWWAIPGAVIFGAINLFLARTSDPRQRLMIGVAGGLAVGLLLGFMLKSRYLPALKVVPMLAWPIGLAVVGFGISTLRKKRPLPLAVGLAFVGWIIGTLGVPNLGPGTRLETVMVFAVAGLLAGGLVGLSRLPDATGRTRIDTKSRAWIFMAPALLFISATLIIPGIITAILSLRNNDGEGFVGLENYAQLFRTGGSWNERNFDLSSWSDVLTSRLLFFGLPLVLIGLGLAMIQGRRTGRTTEFSPHSGGILVGGVVLLAFAVFTSFRGTIFNNLWWVFAVTLFATGLGLAIASWTDGIRGERVAKSLIFMPMAISFVGAGIIWRFMYRSQDVSKTQTGFLNAVWVWLGAKTGRAAPSKGDAEDFDPERYSDLGIGFLDFELFHFNAKWLFVLVFLLATALLIWRGVLSWPRHQEAGAVGYGLAALIPAYLAFRTATEGIGGYIERDDGTVLVRPITFLETGPFNNFWLMVVLLWIETGFAMVIFSAAIKAVPAEFIEAAKIDGADDTQVFWRITIPQIAPTIGVVVTTIIVRVTKVYDIVKVMTGGNFDTNVLANEMISQAFQFGNSGAGSALAIVLFLSVLPIMYMNIRRMQREAA